MAFTFLFYATPGPGIRFLSKKKGFQLASEKTNYGKISSTSLQASSLSSDADLINQN